MQWYDVLKFSLECLSYLATISLVVIGLYGLNQLRLAKHSLHTQSLRDAKKTASEQVVYFLEQVVRNRDGARPTGAEAKLLNSFKYDSESIHKLDLEKIKDYKPKYSEDNIEEYVEEYEKAVRNVFSGKLNSMEAFSASVLSGVSDEKHVYDSVGVTFVSILKETSLIEYVKYKNKKGLYFNQTRKLFKLWNARYTKQLTESMLKEITVEHDKETKKLDDIKGRIESIVADEINPIGVVSSTKVKKNSVKKKTK